MCTVAASVHVRLGFVDELGGGDDGAGAAGLAGQLGDERDVAGRRRAASARA